MPRELMVTGQFPAYTAGTLFRTGPQTRQVGDFAIGHWFDGFSMVHKFEIIDRHDSSPPSVRYSSRSQVDALLERARKDRELPGVSFGQRRDPCDSFLKKVKSVYTAASRKAGGDLANVNVTVFRTPGKSENEALSVMTDASVRRGFDPATLEPFGVAEQGSLHPDLSGPISAAHPSVDPVTGDFFNFNVTFGPTSTYRFFKTEMSTGKTEILASISDKKLPPAYIHSMFLTESYFIFCIWPSYFAGFGASLLWERNFRDALKFDKSAQCHWLVIDRRGSRGIVKRFTSPAMFAFHSTNSFEEVQQDGTVDLFCEIVQFPDMDILERFYYENLVSTGSGVAKYTTDASRHPSLVRYKLAGIPASSGAKA